MSDAARPALERSDVVSARVVLVAGRARNGVIGRAGGIPWHLPADFAHFKRVTMGHPLVLGRTTFEGIGRPLPGRQNIVVTRDPGWSFDGVLVAPSVLEALELGAALDETVMVGGGAQVYRAAWAWATHQILTEVDAEPDGDTFYPAFEESVWHETRREEHPDSDPSYLIRWLDRMR